ncbi:mechanosensitive ion channel family protein [Luteimonas notoginsengisoli]|jgi:small-conductance mechanosensitive channel|uniref:Mechanosensitive ion channel family protein n=1 Tax=Luteimonas notoginsengisoli TaxID=1578200 RepID=A0ABV7UTZ9_9GAMM
MPDGIITSMHASAPVPDWPLVFEIAWPLLVALLLGWLLRRGLLAVTRRARLREHESLRARIVQVISIPASIALPLLFLDAAVATTPLPQRWIDGIQHAIAVALLLCLAWLGVRAVRAIQLRVIRDHPVDVADNLAARRVQTQTRVIGGVVQGAIVLVGVALALMTFPSIRQLGATLLASAGVLGLVAGIAAKPVFGNLIAGLQIALAQPIRLDDVVIVQGEWGRIEEITATYVVVRIWDERRMVVPLQWFIENPFENWTRTSAQLLGTTFLWLDYRTPLAQVREALQGICNTDERWDGRVCVAQVTDTSESTVQVRLLVSARNSGDLFDLRCAVRERMIDYLNRAHPESLPRMRMSLDRTALHDGDALPQHRALDALHAGSAQVTEQTVSPGAEDVNDADAAAGQAPSPAPPPT